jgi:hypothetical protein
LDVPVKEFFDDGSETAAMAPHRLSLTVAMADRTRRMTDDQIEATLRMIEAMWPNATDRAS